MRRVWTGLSHRSHRNIFHRVDGRRVSSLYHVDVAQTLTVAIRCLLDKAYHDQVAMFTIDLDTYPNVAKD